MAKTKLIRNLKKGDKFVVRREDGVSATITVQGVQETQRAWFTGKRQWEVIAHDWPFWWCFGLRGYSTDRIGLVD